LNLRTAHALSAALTASVFAVTGVLYERLPDPMPNHWNFRYEVDGWIGKPWGAFMLPVFMVGVLGVMATAARFGPQRLRTEPFASAYARLEVALVTLFAAIAVATLWAALAHSGEAIRAMPGAGGLVLIAIGASFTNLPRNNWIGIRTPWTLASNEVWRRTHQLGAKLFVAAGLVTIASAPTGYSLVVLLSSLILASIASLAHSYVLRAGS
jgi:uncharacterized membrane protein